MPRSGIAVGFACEFALLEVRVRTHAALVEVACEFEHTVVERMKAGKRNELEFVAHLAERFAELRDALLVELFLPVERGRTIVGEQLAGEPRMNRLREFAR